ncbi:MAG: cell division protein FtsQ/DivIB, partial [Candidatus Limnocylindrales bacterium]
ADVQARLGVDDGTNLVTLRTDDLAGRLDNLPAVRSATVSVDLPNTIAVRLDERRPILVWQVAGARFLVDATGVAFVQLAEGAATPSGLPTISDARAGPGLGLGDSIDPVTFDAATRLGSLTPAEIGSAANGLIISLTDDQGFTMRAVPNLWTAVFGFYTTSLRPPTMIPGQVRLLASLIGGREPTIESLILADDQNGTYVTKATKP